MWTRVDIQLGKQLCLAAKSCGVSINEFVPDIRPSEPQFGEFQCNGILPYAKSHGANPRRLAEQIAEKLKTNKLFEKKILIEVAGPGFINFRLSNEFLADWLNSYKYVDDYKSGISNQFLGKKIVLDYSSPNTAKQMHVGHLRSMNIGNAIYRLLTFCGAKVIRDNHIGDWGTQFGILLMAIKRKNLSINNLSLEDIEALYQYGDVLIKEDQNAMSEARHELVKLQNHDPDNIAIWQAINKASLSSFEKIYDEMGIKFDHTLGESFYHDKVDRIYKELTESNIAAEDDGALCVFHKEHDRFKNQPFIIRKSDKSSNYATTDLATIIYRIEAFGADEIIYVTDGRQQDHFQQLFLTTDKWCAAFGYKKPKLKHVWFGTILGEDGRAIKTRSGSSIKLKDLLFEAKSRALSIVDEKSRDLSTNQKEHIANVLGINSIKYSDLMSNRTNDYIFSWDKMLAFDGNTAVYILYTITRIKSVLSKAKNESNSLSIDSIETEEERSLARKLIYFPMILAQAAEDLRPHHICTYLFELAGEYSTFYNSNRILDITPNLTRRRLTITLRTLDTLELGINLLGLESLQKM